MLIQSYSLDDFNFWLPLAKARAEANPTGQIIRRIRGVASTPDQDLQKEDIDLSHMDYSYFLKYGYFNNDHKPGFENKVGEPTHAEIRNKNTEFYVEGFLYNNHKVADEIWGLMLAQQTTPNTARRIGFSVQGKVKIRSGNHILSSWVQDVAITTAPINTKTWMDMLKSFSAYKIDTEEQRKAFETGYAISNQTGGAALRVQSLDAPLHRLVFKDHKKKKDKKDQLDKSSAVELIQMERGLSRSTARLIVEAHCQNWI